MLAEKAAEDVTLVISVDCGITDFAEIARTMSVIAPSEIPWRQNRDAVWPVGHVDSRRGMVVDAPVGVVASLSTRP